MQRVRTLLIHPQNAANVELYCLHFSLDERIAILNKFLSRHRQHIYNCILWNFSVFKANLNADVTMLK